MNKYPLISIVVPVYNTEKFLNKCLDSVIQQNYPNLEIVVGNNESTDGSQKIIEKYASNDIRIHSFSISHVDTVKKSRDNCIARANGDWIVFVDSDDAIEDGYINKLYKRQLETSGDIICGTMCSRLPDDSIKSKLPTPSFDYDQTFNGEEAMSRTLRKWEFGLNGALIRRTIIDNLATDRNSKVYSDECDSRRYLLNCRKVAFSKAEYYFSYNPNSTGRRMSPAKLNYPLLTSIGIYELMKEKSLKKYFPITIKKIEYVYVGIIFLLLKNRSKLKSMDTKQTFEYLKAAYTLLKKEGNINYVKLSIYHVLLKGINGIY